jgi:predicted DNA binding CopG/RHH family protein
VGRRQERPEPPNHGVSFEEATTVFYDERALLIEDPEGRHSDRVEAMRKSYDFSKARRNPYARRLKRQITIRLDEDTLAYFKQLAEEAEIPYQTLINFYLRECARTKRRPSMRWKAA